MDTQATSSNIRNSAVERLATSRENEIIQQFVRVNMEDEGVKEDPKYMVKFILPHQKGDTVQQAPLPDVETEREKETEKSPEDGEETGEKTPATPDDAPKKKKLNQKQIAQELKKKRRKKKRPRPEELYTDKDRAAAVNMGNRDIKQSLKLKRKLDRTSALQLPEEAEPSTFLALGNYEMTQGELKMALSFMNKALELNPADKNALVGRSKCYILLGQPKNGLKDAETALEVDKKFFKAIYQKAEALYFLGDFEHSLMYYHRGQRIRPDHEGFKLGIRKAQKAIENAIGCSLAGLAQKRSTSSKTPTTARSKLSISQKPSPHSPILQNQEPKSSSANINTDSTVKSSQRSTPMAKPKSSKSRVLRELGVDKEYLENLLKHPDLKCKYKEDDTTIIGHIKEAIDFLNNRQEFWRQQLPVNRKRM